MEREKLQSDKRRQLVHPLVTLSIFFVIAVLSLGDLMEIIPFFAPVVASPIFPFFHEINNLLAMGVVLYTAYKYKYPTRLRVAAVLVFLAGHIPYIIIQFPEDKLELLRIVTLGFIAFLGVWLINRLYKSEQRLRVSEERYRTLVENALIGVYRSNLKGDILYVNNALVSMLGFDSVEEMIAGGAVVRYKNPGDRAILIKELTEKGKVNSFEFEVLTKTGEIKTVIINTILEGNTLSGTLLDITERKRAEERISHLTTVLKTIRNINQLITHEKDSQSLIQQSCNLLVQRQGYDRAWICLLDEKRNSVTVGSAGLREHDSAFLKQLETGSYPECVKELLSQEQSFLAYDRPGKQHQGCVQADEHSSRGVFRSKLEYGGKLYGILGVTIPLGAVFDKEEQALFRELSVDISFSLYNIEQEGKHRQAEEVLRRAEQNFRISLDDSPLGIRIINADGETTYANRALLDLYDFDSLQELQRIPSKKVYTPESYAEHRKRVEKRQRGEYVPSSYEISIVSKDGKIRHLEVIRKDVLWNGKPQFQMLYRDITEVKQLQEQLIMQDRLASIGQLVSGVAHELNNPLTSVIGFSELLLQRELPDDVKADLKIVNDEAKRTSLIVRNLLTFARQQPQEKRAIDINEPIQTVLQLRSHEQSTNNIKLDTHLAPDLPQIIGNGSQLQQVFLNIITNAEFAMLEAHNKGTLTVTTKQQGNFVRTSFTDDGPGIPQENMARLFSPFFTTKEPGKGTGLGLSICQGIITEHGGRIWAKSEPAKGVTFIIELPVYKSPQEEKSK